MTTRHYFGKIENFNRNGTCTLLFDNGDAPPNPSNGLWIPLSDKLSAKKKHDQYKQSFLKWLTPATVIGVGLTTVTAIAGLSYYLSNRKGREERGEEQNPQTNRDENGEKELSISTASVQFVPLQEGDMSARITEWRYHADKNSTSEYVIDEGRMLANELMNLDLSKKKLTDIDIKEYVNFLTIIANTQHGESGDMLLESVNKRTTELIEKAWKLLELAGEDPELEIMRLEISTRLQDRFLMTEIFNRLIQKYDSEPRNEQELCLFFHLFITSPHLGKWYHTRHFGNFLKDKLKNFHEAAKKKFFPDYEVLWDLAKEEYDEYGDAEPSQVKWQEFRIMSHALKFNRVECTDPREKKKILDKMEERTKWTNYPLKDSEKFRVFRLGAVVGMLSRAKTDCFMVGPMRDNRMKMRAYQVIEGIRQTEIYELKMVSNHQPVTHWKGKFVLIQEPAEIDGNNGHIKKKVIFDAKITLCLVQKKLTSGA